MYAQQKLEEKLILQQADGPLDFLWLNRIADFFDRTRSRLRHKQDCNSRQLLISRMNERQLRDIGVEETAGLRAYSIGYRNHQIGRHWTV